MPTRIFLFVLFLLTDTAFAQDSLTIDQCGEHLKQFYLKQDVLNKWIAGQHINWETGEPDDPSATKEIKSHCSAFVASVCEQQNIYILRPPQHKQELLANAQYKWLNSKKAFEDGWKKIETDIYTTAQKLADQGYIVIAAYKNDNPHKPGHIALVMPAVQTRKELSDHGPIMIQAGGKNAVNATFKYCFRHHLEDSPTSKDEIVFFYNSKKIECN